MKSLLIAALAGASALCGHTSIINNTDSPINAEDLKVLERAKLVCKNTYGGCVKIFEKYEDNKYNVTCYRGDE